jgi:tRNA threonylcarbamoyladenosine biosynthesis protein TsaE
LIRPDEQASKAAGSALASVARAGDVITLSGELGAGKTTLARGFLTAAGYRGEAPSPTFAIVQPYDDISPAVWHVDLYRIEDAADIAELGLEEADDAVLLVEWPERAGPGAWPNALSLRLDFMADGTRCLTAKVPPAWEDRWPPR